MGYQALLFCPDEKTARPVTQVLSELDFTVTPCTEPFAAVKKLMGEHFDAVVVDCDNEQNATLLFKSARNTALNQSSLAVAVVEGQAGVAKAFRIGANLVLTKPINVEQAKGTLRVARGLLRKNDAKPATAAAGTAPAASLPVPSQSVPAAPQESTISAPKVARPATPAAPLAGAITRSATAAKVPSISAPKLQDAVNRTEPAAEASPEIAPPTLAKSVAPVSASETNLNSTEPKTPATREVFGGSAGSAPAPARETKAVVSPEDKVSAVVPQAESTGRSPEFHENQPSTPATAAPVPEFTFGGALSGESKPASGGSKKLALVAVAVVVLGAGSYAAWMHWGQSNEAANAPVPRVAPQVQTPAAVPQTYKPAHVEPSAASDSTVSAVTEKEDSHSGKAAVANDSSKPSPSSVLANKAPAAREEAAPIVIKNNLTKPVANPVASAEAPAVSMSGIAPADNGGLPNLLDNHSSTPAPVLQTVNVSKGVSQGLLFKQVQPKYPPNALRLRIEGAVELMATISKSGSISAVSVLSGDPQLAHAALDAVKQWKYKPYLLNGSPVEIQTQITVKFKLPN